MSIPPALAEQAEADAMYEFASFASASVQEELGIASLRIGGGTAMSVRSDPTNFWSRALGFGFDEPVTRDLVEEICGFYRKQETSLAILQFAPSVLPEDWTDICAATGISGGASWVKMARELTADDGPDEQILDAGLRITVARPDEATEWAETYVDGFGWPRGPLVGMAGAHIGKAGWQSFAIREAEEIVGTGTLHVFGDAGELFGAATLPKARGRGAQSAVLVARIAAARAAGCRWVVAETGAERPGQHNSSLHNMRRAGLDVLYERRNWIWKPAG